MMTRVALTALLLLLGACSYFDNGPRPSAAVRTGTGPDADLIAACRRQAERTIIYSDRGQAARDDEALTMSDATNNIPSMRIRSDQQTRIMRRDQLVEECVRQNRGGPVPVDARPATTTRSGTTTRSTTSSRRVTIQ